jgi:hypothetical protein
MKVIANIDSNRVLCEVTVGELALLHGFRTQYDNAFSKERATQVGTECNLTKMVNTSLFVRGLRKKTLKDTKEKLEKAIQEVDAAMEIVSSVETFDILSEEEQIE